MVVNNFGFALDDACALLGADGWGFEEAAV
jgi:hypothetical protein